MKKSMVDLVGFLLVAVFVSYPLISVAQETTSVPFTAVEEEKKEQKQEIESSCASRRLYFGGEYIYSDVKMDAMDDYVAWLNAAGNNIETFDFAQGFNVYLAFFFNENFGIELGYERLETDLSGISTTPGYFEAETSVDGVVVSLVLQKSLGQGNFTMGGKVGAGYYWLDYEEFEDGLKWFSWDDSEIGYKASVFSNYCMTKNLSIYLSGGYRYLVSEKFDIPLITPYTGAELEYSGFFGTIGLTLGW